jgi:type 1 glutamine amidotransferase
MPRALIVWGGWDGHKPRETAELLRQMLVSHDYDVVVTADIAALGAPDIGTMDLVIPYLTNAEIEKQTVLNLTAAVRAGTGLAGHHAALATSFRSSTDFHFLTGVQWVAHPGNIIDFRVEIARPDDPLVAGIADFGYRSEQYYLHYDPSIEILATTTFTGEHDPVTAGVTMPVVFKRRFGEGRIFYSALGHVPQELSHPAARAFLERGLLWATRRSGSR